VELFVPQTVNIVVKSRSFIGGVSNHVLKSVEKNAQTLHVIADNFIGGVDIKN
jgi:predicted membrane protein